MRAAALTGATAVATAGLTWLVGWWGVPLVGVAAGVVARGTRRVGVWTALGAALGWLVLLAADAAIGPAALARLTSDLGGVFRVPGVVLVLVTLLFAALLAWSAAVLARAAALAARRDHGAS